MVSSNYNVSRNSFDKLKSSFYAPIPEGAVYCSLLCFLDGAACCTLLARSVYFESCDVCCVICVLWCVLSAVF